jgi:GNAT superfamily N-acetyltransferase
LHENVFIDQLHLYLDDFMEGSTMKYSSTDYTFREAKENDKDFLYSLQKITLGEYVDRTWGWDELWQKKHFFNHFNPQTLKIIQVKGTDIGVLSVEEKNEMVFLRIIEILPHYQNRGIGTSIIEEVIQHAISHGKSIRLQVLRVNVRARALYERLGFCVIEETDTHYLMKYTL